MLEQTHAALRRVATLVAQGGEPELIFSSVVGEVGPLLGSEFAVVRRYEPGDRIRDVALWSRSRKPYPPISDESVPLGGRNVSSLVFETASPARIDDYDGDAGAAAAPALAAGVHSTVGAPINVGGRLWGVILVSWTHEQPMPAETDSRLAEFAELVATAIANAEAREQLQRIADEQTALRRVATLVATSASPADVFAAVAAELRDLVVGADVAVIARFDADASATVVAGVGDFAVIGERWKLTPPGAVAQVYKTGEAARCEGSSENPGMTAAERARKAQIRSAVAGPIVVNSRLWGAAAVASRTRRLPDAAEERLVTFTELVAVAISNAEDRKELTASRARIVAAADQTRRRIERDLHDGIQQRLIRLSLALRTTERQLPGDRPDVRDSVAKAAAELADILAELQEISRGIHPPILAQGGLGPALRTLARRGTIPVDVTADSEERLPENVEVAAYYVVAEALANVAKHAEATRATVDLHVDNRILTLRVRDDGRGGADPRRGSGLVGLSDRVQALGGSIEIDSPAAAGTTIVAQLPISEVG